MNWERDDEMDCSTSSTEPRPKPCRWCSEPWDQVYHTICPRVCAIEYYPDSAQVKRVEFWPEARADPIEDISHSPAMLLDTSVIIDGRIADICQAGFIAGEMLVPGFVLNELQSIADSTDALRRNRGRRGLEMLHRLQDEPATPLHVIGADAEGDGVDEKLVSLAKQLGCAIVTNDYNLNRVAELQGVQVLNVNDLANAVRAIVLPGESLLIEIVQQGKEDGQGVGYLDDGMIVVVESGKPFVGEQIEVIVTKTLQTVAGRMLFARPGKVEG
jgi:uncharacterized protein YacL